MEAGEGKRKERDHVIDVKICGIKTKPVRDMAVKMGADYLGFMFWPESPRTIELLAAKDLRTGLPSSVRAVAVTVNADNDRLDMIMEQVKPDMIQAHGDESPARIADMKERYQCPVIKAIPVASADDVRQACCYQSADMILFDAKINAAAGFSGGSGRRFDWHLLAQADMPAQWMLAGGLDVDNIAEAVKISGAYCVDVSSGVESMRGEKDPNLVADFLKMAKTL